MINGLLSLARRYQHGFSRSGWIGRAVRPLLPLHFGQATDFVRENLVIDTIHERQTGLGCLVWLEYAINSWKPYCRPGPGTALLWRPICNTILPQGVEQEELRPGDGAAGLFGSNEEAAELRLAGLERWSWGDYHFPDKNCGWLEAWRARAEFIRTHGHFDNGEEVSPQYETFNGWDQGVFHAANRGRIEEWKQEVRDTLEEDLRAEEVMNELFRNSRN